MRIAVATWTNRAAGGVETYLEHVVAALSSLGHEVSVWHEASEPSSRSPLSFPSSVRVARLDRSAGPRELARWAPDVVMANGLADPSLERDVHRVAPTVFVAHNYHGTCISGTKCWSAPDRRPCSRAFGWQCLAHYYPHRCGGLHPLTMLRMYRTAGDRLATVRASDHVVTLSSHMRDEYVRHGVPAEHVTVVPYGPPAPGAAAVARPDPGRATIVYVGRLELLKGVDLLFDALPAVRRMLDRAVGVVVVGDGSLRAVLERCAAELVSGDPGLTIEFRGWQGPRERDAALASADVLAVPGPWPEPFGIVGIEAAHFGVPAVAFAVGGVPDWLEDGVTGRLASASPPTAGSLAAALCAVLRDPVERAAMGVRARDAATRRSPERHAALLAERLSSTRRRAGGAA